MKIETKQITCDTCQSDLWSPNGRASLHIIVSTFRRKIGDYYQGGCNHAPIDSDKHFCDLRCLKTYFEQEKFNENS
jgi:hypothetical protein